MTTFSSPFCVTDTNVNTVVPRAVALLSQYAVGRDSRNGPVLELPAPFITTYTKPWQRVLFSNHRDANPFFHFFEALWMFNGNNDVEFLKRFVRNIDQFSDDGKTFHGAYGFRWKAVFGLNQITSVVNILKSDPCSRRAVISMWHPIRDLDSTCKDLPCNTHIYFKIRDNLLHMTVCCRSNDIVWGLYGSNVVHFSMLQELIANMLGVQMGPYTHLSDSLHAYVDTWRKLRDANDIVDRYSGGTFVSSPSIITSHDASGKFFDYLAAFMIAARAAARTNAILEESPDKFLRTVATPLFNTHHYFQQGRWEAAFEALEKCVATDWKFAVHSWLTKRAEISRAKQLNKSTTKVEATPTPPNHHMDFIEAISKADADGLIASQKSYGDSWLSRGGSGVWAMLHRKWDRIEFDVKSHTKPWDILDRYLLREGGSVAHHVDNVRDLRRYLMLVSARHWGDVNHMDWLSNVSVDDLTTLRDKRKTHGDTWIARGGASAFHRLAKNWDRLAMQVEKHDGDIWLAIKNDTRLESIMSDIDSLRQFLLLVEAEATARGYLKAN